MATIIIVGIAVGLYLLGRFVLGTGANPPTISPGSNSDQETCNQHCSQLRNRRQEKCNREEDEKTARARADALRGQLWAAVGTAGGLIAAAATAAAIPLVGQGIAAGLLAAAAVFLAIAAVLAGELGAAEADLAEKAAAAQAARAAEAEAVRLFGEKCPPEEIEKCLRTMTC